MTRALTALKIVGALLIVAGAVLLISALGSSRDQSAMALGSTGFSLGALLVAGAFYGQSRGSELGTLGTRFRERRKNRAEKCGICQKTRALVRCTLHRVALCPVCLHRHDSAKWCSYVPLVRRDDAKAPGSLHRGH